MSSEDPAADAAAEDSAAGAADDPARLNNLTSAPAAPSATPNFPAEGKHGEAVARITGTTASGLWRPQYSGFIRSFSEQTGFGFIESERARADFDRDVFVHRHQMAESNLTLGQSVLFEVQLNNRGQPQARNVIPMSPRDASLDGQAGYDGMGGMGNHGDSWGDEWGYGYGFGDDEGGMGHGKGKATRGAGGNCYSSSPGGAAGPSSDDKIAETLRACQSSNDMWEIIEQHAHAFGQIHVVAALYQLGLFRWYGRRTPNTPLIGALMDRLVQYQPQELTADEVSKVVWAMGMLDEVKTDTKRVDFAVRLGHEAIKRPDDYEPLKMRLLVSGLSRLVYGTDNTWVVDKLITTFTDYTLGHMGRPRFPPEQLDIWISFLKESIVHRPPLQRR